MNRQDLSYDIGGPINGFVEYDDKQKHPKVLFRVVLRGNPRGANAIKKYLQTPRTFSLPMEDVEAKGYTEETHVPTANIRLFEQAMMGLGSEFGIFLA